MHADPSLRWAHMRDGAFSDVAAHLMVFNKGLVKDFEKCSYKVIRLAIVINQVVTDSDTTVVYDGWFHRDRHAGQTSCFVLDHF